ncbi:MAG: hypothetical protein AVDCRST_MAG67-4097 [uncultured Solirubrobacteraceae bacterium]|uniref:Uncharacterized protein n=1 Tax=uncultured Solirubrobacteraceae bacterium TaxID=1162706 RepID=A0A6J4TSH0_9ACTN|nr:MAG: hypothetical protein AVDCRST_MAG67-4097 [uncultured Solirubrobacteraceae bacterium]
MDALHRLEVLRLGRVSAIDSEPAAQPVDDLVERVTLDAGTDWALLAARSTAPVLPRSSKALYDVLKREAQVRLVDAPRSHIRRWAISLR